MVAICARLFSVEMYLLLTNIFPITLSGWDFLSVGSYLTQNQVPLWDSWRGAPSGGVKTRGSQSLSPCSPASNQLRLPLGEGNGTPLAASPRLAVNTLQRENITQNFSSFLIWGLRTPVPLGCNSRHGFLWNPMRPVICI